MFGDSDFQASEVLDVLDLWVALRFGIKCAELTRIFGSGNYCGGLKFSVPKIIWELDLSGSLRFVGASLILASKDERLQAASFVGDITPRLNKLARFGYRPKIKA